MHLRLSVTRRPGCRPSRVAGHARKAKSTKNDRNHLKLPSLPITSHHDHFHWKITRLDPPNLQLVKSKEEPWSFWKCPISDLCHNLMLECPVSAITVMMTSLQTSLTVMTSLEKGPRPLPPKAEIAFCPLFTLCPSYEQRLINVVAVWRDKRRPWGFHI